MKCQLLKKAEQMFNDNEYFLQIKEYEKIINRDISLLNFVKLLKNGRKKEITSKN